MTKNALVTLFKRNNEVSPQDIATAKSLLPATTKKVDRRRAKFDERYDFIQGMIYIKFLNFQRSEDQSEREEKLIKLSLITVIFTLFNPGLDFRTTSKLVYDSWDIFKYGKLTCRQEDLPTPPALPRLR